MSISFVSGKADGQLPIHQLTKPLTAAWMCGGNMRSNIASGLATQYLYGCKVASITGWIIATVAPNGKVRELLPPFESIKNHQLANQPTANECYCRDWYYPECEGPWSMMNSPDHHPMCSFDWASMEVYQKVGRKVQDRPDAWNKCREEIRKSR